MYNHTEPRKRLSVNLDPAKLIAIANKAKTPLALAGGVIAVLYLIYRQVLTLGIFSKLESRPTFVLIQGLVDRLFWLALVALVLGVASYLAVALLKNRADQEPDFVDLPVRKSKRTPTKTNGR